MSKNTFIREIRINPIIPAESVLVATERGNRPQNQEEQAPRDTRSHVEQCPFCVGNEEKTPPPILTLPDKEHWSIRVVENLYPVLGESSKEINNLNFGLQQAIDGYGHHEVIIDSNNHGIAVHEMTQEHLTLLMTTYRDRMRTLYENERINYVLVFKNFGPAAGASIRHTHSQIIATPVVPQNIHDEVENSFQHYQKANQCIFCSLIDEALTFETTIYDRESGEVKRKINVGQYVIERTEHFIAIKPFASRFEWEVHILPLKHESDFTTCNTELLADLAYITQRTMMRLDQILGGVQYNYFLHSAPKRDSRETIKHAFHWHLEIVPRTSIPTGFELGSGLFVNTISPEEAAEKLRDISL